MWFWWSHITVYHHHLHFHILLFDLAQWNSVLDWVTVDVACMRVVVSVQMFGGWFCWCKATIVKAVLLQRSTCQEISARLCWPRTTMASVAHHGSALGKLWDVLARDGIGTAVAPRMLARVLALLWKRCFSGTVSFNVCWMTSFWGKLLVLRVILDTCYVCVWVFEVFENLCLSGSINFCSAKVILGDFVWENVNSFVVNFFGIKVLFMPDTDNYAQSWRCYFNASCIV